jgi:NAD(P)-dependent dehydrogenase (short-subunit alcohol dehydrogenase family)
MLSIKGKTVVITGATSGLGRAWVEGFANEQATVISADINAEGLDGLPVDVIGIKTDVRDNDQVEAMISKAMDVTGRVDVLFNNAGNALGFATEEYPPGSFEDLIAVHLFGCIYGMRAVIPIMRTQGHGRIINTVSRGAEVCGAKSGAYSAAKAAMWSATRGAAAETRDSGILINMLIPGPTNTAIWKRAMPQLQSPEVTYPTARFLATLPDDEPDGRVFWNEKEYQLFRNVYEASA